MSDRTGDSPAVLVEVADFDVRDQAGRRARECLSTMLANRGGLDWDRADDCLLLLSEVVTNVVKHARMREASTVRVIWLRTGDILRTEVFDPDPRTPEIATPCGDEDSGRGLILVDALADRWGVEPVPSYDDMLWPGSRGKVVWFAVGGVWPASSYVRIADKPASSR